MAISLDKGEYGFNRLSHEGDDCNLGGRYGLLKSDVFDSEVWVEAHGDEFCAKVGGA